MKVFLRPAVPKADSNKKKMTVDQPPPLSKAKRKASGSLSMGVSSKRARISKSDIKLSLVAQRISMLEDDNTEQEPSGYPSKNGCINKTNDIVDDSYDDKKCKPSAMKRAEEVQANLRANYPSFTKYMLRSHVTLGFWLGLPKKFCDKHLPKHDSTVVLVDEDGNTYETNYLAGKVGLSGGWRGFSLSHHLQEGDVAVFQLVGLSTFKVYIVRADNFAEVDGALGLLHLDSSADRIMLDESIGAQNSQKKCLKQLPRDIAQENVEDHKLITTANPSESVEHYLSSQVMDGIRLAESAVCFENVERFESFSILVDGLIIDSKFSDHLRRKYYELCCSQKSFLHEHLLQGLNCTLIVGIISEIVNIADAIRACKASASHNDLLIWKKTLMAFQHLGMNVDFLRARLQVLWPEPKSKEVSAVESESCSFEKAKL
ncbi:hypothetical protein Nepgr_004540 [Nepenthes gracilis]|uniref:TF-B3 domain-containing protein n=1 Tax=Nepenthes gracilis TaxID=150966 RepID=A0AAD3XFI4_NEPGR|nr:hypothetical protein Nepgr_004540 [Nepenthes gracilis]